MTTLIAIYGAVLSTIIAIVHLRSLWVSERFIHVRIERFLVDKGEILEFIISNRSKDLTEVQEVMVGNYGSGGEVGFSMAWGRGIELFTGGKIKEKQKVISLPIRLAPGETITCSYETGDAEKDMKFFASPKIVPDCIYSNLFYLEVEHSRSNRAKEFLFEMDLEYLSKQFSNWKKSVPVIYRWKYWPVARAYH